MGNWHLAPSLVNLRSEIHSRWPNHDRTSDGSVGDTSHSSSVSDHNPNSRGSVNAIDEDKDGVDMNVILAAVKRHPSAHYFIYKFPGQPTKIWDSHNNWNPQTYTGTNPHDKHCHISIYQSKAAEDNQTGWGIWPIPEEGLDMDPIDVHHAVWDDYTMSETGDMDSDGTRDLKTPKQLLLDAHQLSVENREEVKKIKQALGITD